MKVPPRPGVDMQKLAIFQRKGNSWVRVQNQQRSRNTIIFKAPEIGYYRAFAPLLARQQERDASAEETLEAYTYPNPVLSGNAPTLRVFAGDQRVRDLHARIHDVSGEKQADIRFSSPVMTLDETGKLVFDVTLPADLAPGVYYLVVEATGENNASLGRRTVKFTVR